MCTKLLHPHKMWCAKFCTPIYTCAQNICHAPKNDEDHERLEGFDKSLLLRKLWAPATYCAKTQSSHAIRQNMCSTSTMVNRALLMLKLTFLSGKNVKWSCLKVRQGFEQVCKINALVAISMGSSILSKVPISSCPSKISCVSRFCPKLRDPRTCCPNLCAMGTSTILS